MAAEVSGALPPPLSISALCGGRALDGERALGTETGNTGNVFVFGLFHVRGRSTLIRGGLLLPRAKPMRLLSLLNSLLLTWQTW